MNFKVLYFLVLVMTVLHGGRCIEKLSVMEEEEMKEFESRGIQKQVTGSIYYNSLSLAWL